MTARVGFATRDERGAALILAIAFLVVIGGIGAAVISSLSSGLKDRAVLDQDRNREYAADGGVERSIARVRGLPTPGVSDCASPDIYAQLNGVAIRVDCINAPAVAVGSTGDLVAQNDVIFTACVSTGKPCSDTNKNVIIRAQVNYQGTGSPSQVKTFVQAWSVNS